MAVAPIRIPTLTQRYPIVDKDGRPTVEFLRTINGALQSIGYALNQVIALPDIQAALAGLDAATAAALAAAANAQAAADNAGTVADTTTAQTNLANSYVTGCTISGTDAGTDATIDITSHMRVYGDGTSVAVNGGTLTGLVYDTLYYITYQDPTRAGGAVTYVATTNVANAAQLGDRHVVGRVATPAAGDPDTTGRPVLPPGAGATGDQT